MGCVASNGKTVASSVEVPELRDLGERVASARRARRLNQIELAFRCGLSQAAISAIESGKRRPSLEQFFRIARALGVPIQRLIDGKYSPGWELPDIAVQLRSLGIVDLRVRDAKVPGAFVWSEEVIAVAARGDEPDPRIITALPAVLAWNDWDSELLKYFARNVDIVLLSAEGTDDESVERKLEMLEDEARRRVVYRLAWLADIALAIDRRRGFPGGCLSRRRLPRFVKGLPPRPRADAWDGLGRPKADTPRSPIWKRWRINFDAAISEFEKRAEQLVELGGGVH